MNRKKNIKKRTFKYFIKLILCSLISKTTTGFGDLKAKNIYEKMFITLMMLIGVLSFSFVISVLYEKIRNVGEDNQILEKQKK